MTIKAEKITIGFIGPPGIVCGTAWISFVHALDGKECSAASTLRLCQLASIESSKCGTVRSSSVHSSVKTYINRFMGGLKLSAFAIEKIKKSPGN